MKLQLDKRPCLIGSSINTRTEKHGDEDVTALDIPLSGIMLTNAELNNLANEPLLSEVLFNKRRDGLREPMLKGFKPLAMTVKFDECTVILKCGLKDKTIKLTDVTLKSLRLDPKVGGLTELSLLIQCTPELDDKITTLLAFLNHTADVEIKIGVAQKAADDKQDELPLNGNETKPSAPSADAPAAAADSAPAPAAEKPKRSHHKKVH